MHADPPAHRGGLGAAAKKVSDELVTEADPDDFAAGRHGAADELRQLADPGLLVVNAVTAARDQVGVALSRLGKLAVLRSKGHKARKAIPVPTEKLHEHARIVAELRLEFLQHRVGLQNADAHRFNGSRQMISK